MKIPKRGTYTGRLTFDPDTLFHTDDNGRRVVTTDGGRTWRYATRKDVSHNARYQLRTLMVDGTANAEQPEPHHWAVQEGDAHYDEVKSHTDVDAPTVTSHTEAWKEQV